MARKYVSKIELLDLVTSGVLEKGEEALVILRFLSTHDWEVVKC